MCPLGMYVVITGGPCFRETGFERFEHPTLPLTVGFQHHRAGFEPPDLNPRFRHVTF